jgi:hypothetical protein
MVLRGLSDIYFDDNSRLREEVLAEKASIEELMWLNDTTAAPSPGLLLLDNFRVTITRRFSTSKCLTVRDWYWRSLREFEEGC